MGGLGGHPQEHPTPPVERPPGFEDIGGDKRWNFDQALQIPTLASFDVGDGSPPRRIILYILHPLRPNPDYERVCVRRRTVHRYQVRPVPEARGVRSTAGSPGRNAPCHDVEPMGWPFHRAFSQRIFLCSFWTARYSQVRSRAARVRRRAICPHYSSRLWQQFEGHEALVSSRTGTRRVPLRSPTWPEKNRGPQKIYPSRSWSTASTVSTSRRICCWTAARVLCS